MGNVFINDEPVSIAAPHVDNAHGCAAPLLLIEFKGLVLGLNPKS